MIPAAENRIAKRERPALRARVVIHVNLKPGGGAFDAALGILKLRDRQLRISVGGQQRIALAVARGRQSSRLLGRDVEFVGTVSQTGNADAGMDAVYGYAHTLLNPKNSTTPRPAAVVHFPRCN